MPEYATIQDVRTIIAEALVPVTERLNKIDGRIDDADGRFDKIDNRFDKMELRQDRMQVSIDDIQNNYRAILVQNEETNTKLDAILEYVADVPDQNARIGRLEENAEHEKLKSELDRSHIDALRSDIEAHRRRPHPTNS
ncbi:MAG TPA: hypothetical protein VMT30_06545 [Candidatus Saccharimonadia bacterium]|nr:hypothetical protein [Candidatus Saccharimonadia bacterium]